MSENYDWLVKVAVDGMDANSVISNLQAQPIGEVNLNDLKGFDLLVKILRFFNLSITIKTSLWVIYNKRWISPLVSMYYRGSLVAFFIKEKSVRTAEEFQAIVKDLNIPVIKILDTPKEFTLEFFEAAIKELIGLYE